MVEITSSQRTPHRFAASQWARMSNGSCGVNKSLAGRLLATAEDPHKADRIAAAPRTENACQERA